MTGCWRVAECDAAAAGQPLRPHQAPGPLSWFVAHDGFTIDPRYVTTFLGYARSYSVHYSTGGWSFGNVSIQFSGIAQFEG